MRPRKNSILEPLNSIDSVRPRHSSAGRRSSNFAQRLSKDPRNVRKDKEENLRLLSEFLTENQFPDEVSTQTLKSPATNYVKNIFLFIFNKFNENLTDFDNFENDVKVFLNLYGCPFNLAKSYLQAPGTLNSWPYILSAIVWLVEVYNFGERLYSQDRASGPLRALGFTAEQYKNFLNGSDIEEAQQKIDQIHERKQNDIRDLLEEENLAQAKLKSELEELAKKPSLAETEKRAQKLKEDSAKFKTLLSKTKEHIASIVKKGRQYSELEETVKEKIKQIALQEEYAKYELDKQQVSRDDVAQMDRERKKLQSELSDFQKKLAEKGKKLETCEAQTKQLCGDLSARAEALNDLLRKICVVPSDAKFAYGNDYGLAVDTTKALGDSDDVGMNLRRVTSVDLKNCLKPHLQQIFTVLLDEKADLATERTRLETFLQDRADKARRLEKERFGAQKGLQNLKSLNEAKIKALEEEREKTNNELFKKKMTVFSNENTPKRLFDLMAAYNALLEKEQTVTKEYEGKRREKTRKILRTIEKFLSYRSLREEEFGQLKELADKLRAAFPVEEG